MSILNAQRLAELCGSFDNFKMFRDAELSGFPAPDSERGRRIIAEGEALLEYVPPVLPLSLYRRFTEDGNRREFEVLYFERRSVAYALMVAELTEQKGRFMRKLCDVLWTILEETTWVVPAHNESFGGGRRIAPIPDVLDDVWYCDLFSAGTAGFLSMCLYLMEDRLNAEIPDLFTRRMRRELRRRIIDPYKDHNDQWWRGYGERSRLNNWSPWIESNLLLTAAVICKDRAERQYMLREGAFTLNRFLDGYDPDGGCNEGPGYWDVAGASLFDCLELIYDMTDGQTGEYFEHPLIRNIVDYIRRVHIADRYFFNCADAHVRCGCGGRLVERAGVRTHNEALRRFGIARGEREALKVRSTDTSRCYREIRNLLEKPTEPTAYEPKTSEFLPDLQFCAMREKPAEREGLYFAVKGGTNGESHNHNDVGSFILYADGEPVLIDAGVGEYTRFTFSDKRYTMFAFRSEDHNLPIICGLRQGTGIGYHAAGFSFDEKTRTVTADLTPAYDDPDGILKSYIRTAKMDGGVITIDDEIQANSGREAEFRFFTCDKPEIKDGFVAFSHGVRGKFDSAENITIVPIPLTDRGFLADWQRDALYYVAVKVCAENGSIRLRTVFDRA